MLGTGRCRRGARGHLTRGLQGLGSLERGEVCVMDCTGQAIRHHAQRFYFCQNLAACPLAWNASSMWSTNTRTLAGTSLRLV